MNDNETIRSQCGILQDLHDKLLELFGETRGSVQFFQHKDQSEIFVIQIRKGHLVDLGSIMMALSFFIREQYDVFHGIAMREQLRMPKGGFRSSEKYEHAFKHAFLRFKFHPELQKQIFGSKHLKQGEIYQDMVRINPIIVEILEQLEVLPSESLSQYLEDSATRT